MAAEHNVFINCPFDNKYKPFFDAVVFAVLDCGFVPRCALETSDSSLLRLQKISKIISDCRYAIHDISRVQLDPKSKLPRFNMPFELGLFLAAKQFGDRNQQKKECIIFDYSPFRYQRMLSDISGLDIKAHRGSLQNIIIGVRDWLESSSRRPNIPSGSIVYKRFQKFKSEYSLLCQRSRLIPEELTFSDYAKVIAMWLKKQDDKP